MRRVRGLLLAGALALAAVHSPVEAAERDTLVLAIGGEPETGFDPVMGWGSYGNPLFQSTLLQRDTELEIQPDLATDWQLSEDRRTWTITLRDDVRFSDGTRLTAHDVAFTFNTAKEAAGEVDLDVMQRAEALDDRTVRITLSRPWITFTENFVTLGIVPKDSYGPDYARAPLGSGPYRFLSWSEGEQLIVERNEYYHGPRAAFGRITFLFTGADAGLAAAFSGKVDMVAVPAPLADTVPEGFHALAVPTVDNRGLSLPFPEPREEDGRKIGHAVTSDPAIRRALNLGIDRDAVVEVALLGHGTPAFGPADGLAWAGEHDQGVYDPEAAIALLEEAGWHEGADGVRARDGIRAEFPIHYPASDATRQALAETTAELLRPLGVQATPRGSSWDAIRRVMNSEPVVFGFGSHSPWQLYSIYAERLGGVDYMNPTYYANPRVEALFEQAQSAESYDASIPFWSAAAEHYGIAGDNAWLWLVNLDHVYLVNDCLDLGPARIEPHGHGWPITATLANWAWTCP